MVGYVFLSLVLLTPGMLPADRPSHSYLKRSPLDAGCSVMRTKAAFFWRACSADADAGPAMALRCCWNSWNVAGSVCLMTSTAIKRDKLHDRWTKRQ